MPSGLSIRIKWAYFRVKLSSPRRISWKLVKKEEKKKHAAPYVPQKAVKSVLQPGLYPNFPRNVPQLRQLSGRSLATARASLRFLNSVFRKLWKLQMFAELRARQKFLKFSAILLRSAALRLNPGHFLWESDNSIRAVNSEGLAYSHLLCAPPDNLFVQISVFLTVGGVLGISLLWNTFQRCPRSFFKLLSLL
jgi:hypothetical protein